MKTEETNTTEAPEIHYGIFRLKMEEEWWEAGEKLFEVYFNPRIFVQVMDDQVPYTNIYLVKKWGHHEQGPTLYRKSLIHEKFDENAALGAGMFEFTKNRPEHFIKGECFYAKGS